MVRPSRNLLGEKEVSMFQFRRSVFVSALLVYPAAFALIPAIVCTTAAGQIKGFRTVSLPKPGQFLGKTIEECEKILGPPGYSAGVGTGNYKDHGNMAQIRYYKSPGLTRLVLMRLVDESIPLAADPEKRLLRPTVSVVSYQIPKARIKTWQAAFNLLGMSTKGVKAEVFPTRHVNLMMPGGAEASWTPAGAHGGPTNRYFVQSKTDHLLSISTLAIDKPVPKDFSALIGRSPEEVSAALGKAPMTRTNVTKRNSTMTYKVPNLGEVNVYFEWAPETKPQSIRVFLNTTSALSAQEYASRLGFELTKGWKASSNGVPIADYSEQVWYVKEASAGLHRMLIGKQKDGSGYRIELTMETDQVNLLKDAKWETYIEAGTDARFEPGTDQVSITANKPGKETYSIQIWPAIASLQNGTNYVLSFEARADREKKFTVGTGMRDEPYAETGLQRNDEPIGPDWRTYQFTFTAKNGDRGVIKVPQFSWGKSSGTLFVRRVSLKLTP